jgi:hypothetical protein
MSRNQHQLQTHTALYLCVINHLTMCHSISTYLGTTLRKRMRLMLNLEERFCKILVSIKGEVVSPISAMLILSF